MIEIGGCAPVMEHVEAGSEVKTGGAERLYN